MATHTIVQQFNDDQILSYLPKDTGITVEQVIAKIAELYNSGVEGDIEWAIGMLSKS